MKNTFNYHFYCRPCRKNASGTAPVEIAVTINKRRTIIQLPYRTTPEEFGKKRRPQELEHYLDAQRVKINRTIAEIADTGQPLTTDTFKQFFISGGLGYTVDNLLKDYLAIQKKRGLSKPLYHKYEFVADLLREEVNATADCSAITNAVIRSFVAKIEKKYENSTAISYFARLKAFIRFGMDNGKLKYNPLQGIKIARKKKKIDFLTEEEIEKLRNVELDTESLRKIRDCSLFQISSGLAYCDCLDLRPEDLQEKDGIYYINKRRHKTGTPFFAIVLPFGAEIFKRYGGRLPFISNQKYNLFLKALAERAKIAKNLHTHIFRHSYCTLLLNKGLNIKIVSRCAGHSTTAMTEQFYAHLHDETIISEASKIF